MYPSRPLSQDIAGWRKLIGKVANRCLLVADCAFQNGLPLTEESQAVVMTECQNEGSSIKLKVEDSEDLVGIDVSCAALTWENSLSSTMDRIDHLKGEFHPFPCNLFA